MEFFVDSDGVGEFDRGEGAEVRCEVFVEVGDEA